MRFRARALLCAAALALSGCRPPSAPRDTVTLLLSSDILSTDPNAEVEAVTDSVLFNVYEPLVGFDKDLQVRTLLAESWEHPSPERWRFQLRHGVKFHDGTALDAAAVKAVFARLMKEPDLDASSFVRQVEEVVVVAPDIVEIVTREPRAILANLPFLYITKPAAGGGLVGTGPYRFHEWKAGDHVGLDRFDGYWGKAGEFAHARFEPVTDADARLRRLAAGTADLVYGVKPEALPRPLPGVRFVHRPGLTVYYLTFNFRAHAGNPYPDRRVREAMNLALDRAELVREGLKGAGTVATQPVASLVFGYDPALPAPPRDLARARALLAEAGFPQGFSGQLHISGSRIDVARLVARQMAQIGIQLQPVATEDVYGAAEAGKSDLFFTGWDCSTGEASEFYEFILHTRDNRFGQGNYGLFSNPDIDAIAEGNAAVLDQRRRQSMLQRAAAIAMQELPVLPLFVQDDIYGVREGLQFEARADSEVRVADLAAAPR
jgi:peptide/nickel transport system substrate-binding protein